MLEVGGATVRVLIGSAFGTTSPVAVRSPMLYLDVTLAAAGDARVVLIGGAPLGPRHVRWNFVSSRRERIEQAADAWAAQRFAAVPGETEFTPLPERRPG